MKMETTAEWDALYQSSDPVPAAKVLVDNLHLLPAKGNALDLACGLAENGLLLAKNNLAVDAWDNSPVAIERVNKTAKKSGLAVNAQVKDVMTANIAVEFYDVIILTHFLEKSISQAVINGLKPGGLLFFQSYTRECVDDVGPENEIFRLKRNELLSLFPGLSIVVYSELGLIGDLKKGLRNEALLIGKKISRHL